MKKNTITILTLIALIGSYSSLAQNWVLGGNTVPTGGGFLGSNNNRALVFETNNIERLRITGAGNLSFATSSQSIQFANPSGTINPMMFMFSSGSSNLSRMVIAHSPSFPTWGLQYADANDQFNFVNAGLPILSVGLASHFVGVNTSSPAVETHIVHGFGSITHGLRINHVSSGINHNWNLYTQSTGLLELSADGTIRGTFNPTSGVYTASSDERRKKDIEIAPDLLTKVLQLQVKKYHFLENKPSDMKYYGMIAQEVEKIFPEIVYHNKMDGGSDYYTMDYSGFGVLAIKAIQEQQQKITDLEARIAKLETALASVSSDKILPTAGAVKDATLEQNQPNPFNQSTTIRYRLPQGAKGQINIYDIRGVLIKSIVTNESGQAKISASGLSTGTYTYTLIVNDRLTASKKLVLTK